MLPSTGRCAKVHLPAPSGGTIEPTTRKRELGGKVIENLATVVGRSTITNEQFEIDSLLVGQHGEKGGQVFSLIEYRHDDGQLWHSRTFRMRAHHGAGILPGDQHSCKPTGGTKKAGP